jgi:hypothetical protein
MPESVVPVSWFHIRKLFARLPSFTKAVVRRKLACVRCFIAARGLPVAASWRGGPIALTERPAKRIPDWLAIDLLLIVVSLVIILVGIWIGL